MKLRSLLVGLGLLAVLATGCSSDSGVSASALLTPKTYGSGNGAFTMSFTQTPTTSPGYAALGSRNNWTGGDVDVAVISHPAAVRPQRIEALLRTYLPFATGGRMYLFDGLPAIKEVVDCTLPSGPCPGKVGGLEVFDGQTFFDVFVSGLDGAATSQALASFRVASVARTPGCSYAVSRKGFAQACA